MQQINLYLDEFKHIEPSYGANTMLLLALASVLGAGFVSVILASLMWWWQGELAGHQKQWQAWQQDLQVAKARYPEPQVDARLVRSITAVKLDIERNRKVLQYLHSRQLDAEHQSFSVYLLALTWVMEKDLWLTEVKISKGGASLSLSGRALTAGALPSYLKKLSEIEVFADMKFRVFEMNRTQEGLTFVVSSDREEKELKDVLELLSGQK